MANRNFAKLNESGQVAYAPSVLVGAQGLKTRPSAADYAAAGWKPVVDERPSVDAEHYAAATGWREADGRIERVYDVRENPPVAHRYETIRIYIGLVKIGKWAAFESWAAEQTIADGEYAGVNLLAAFNRVVIVRDDHPLFAQYIAAAKTALGVDDATVSAILSAAEVA